MGLGSRKNDVSDERHLVELAIIKILARHDLERLVSMGAPEDEYSYESKMIVNALIKASSADTGALPSLSVIASIVEIEFQRSFGTNYGPKDRYSEVELAFVAYEIYGLTWNLKRISQLTWRLK